MYLPPPPPGHLIIAIWNNRIQNGRRIVKKVYSNVLFFYSTDIDECIDHMSKCSQSCINTPGSYVCDCNQGFKLENDSITCSGKSCILQPWLV